MPSERGPLEADIQAQLVEYCQLVAPARGFLFFAVSNEALGKARNGAGLARMAKLRKMGLRSGVADLVFVKAGRAYFLEMKRPGGKQSESQRQFQADAEAVGAPYAVAFSFDEAVEILHGFGVL
jgi:hypothetical protein